MEREEREERATTSLMNTCVGCQQCFRKRESSLLGEDLQFMVFTHPEDKVCFGACKQVWKRILLRRIYLIKSV